MDWLERSAPDDRTYFGEALLHFSHGAPLLLPVSLGGRARLLDDVARRRQAALIDSLDNRVVAVRLASLSDLFLISADGDESGPEADRYGASPGVYLEDAFWHTVEQLYSGELVELAGSARGVAEVLWPGTDAPIRRQGEADADEHTQRFFAHATELMWQCCNGFQRNVWVQDDRELGSLVRALLAWDAATHAFAVVKVDDQQDVLINPDRIDYLSVPGHRLRRALRM